MCVYIYIYIYIYICIYICVILLMLYIVKEFKSMFNLSSLLKFIVSVLFLYQQLDRSKEYLTLYIAIYY